MKVIIVTLVTLFHFSLFFIKFDDRDQETKKEIKIPIKTQMNFSSSSRIKRGDPEPLKEIVQEKSKEVEKPKEAISNKKLVKPKSKTKKIMEKTVEKKVEKVYEKPQAVSEQKIENNEEDGEESKNESLLKEILREDSYNFSEEVYTANSSEGIDYKILKEIDPEYPTRLKNILGRDVVTVKTKFLVDKNGKVAKVVFLEESNKILQKEVEKALKQWVFKPMSYKDKPLEVYFYKEFKFK